jgi:hypothetical protein
MAQNSRETPKLKRERIKEQKKINRISSSPLEAGHTQDRLKGKKKKVQRRKNRKRDKIDQTLWT